MATIELARVDFRLIHGQVVNKWIKITRSNRIVVIDDALAQNDYLKSIYSMAAPPGVKVDVYTLEGAANEWKKDQFGLGNIMVIFKNVADAYHCYKQGFDYKELQIGGLGAVPGRKIVFGPITLDQPDADMLRELSKTGVRVYFHQVPDEASAELEKVLEKARL